ncbi:hypothetical protein C4566_03440 [Candidatus Parcubacteria bacterium]|nr:MAG: hypothetical protein C4566_03440 [Candidatus Parcubacteria bacterium]
MPQRKNIEANESNDDPLFEEEHSTRDFIAELREKAERINNESQTDVTKNDKEKQRVDRMLRQQRIRESIRSGQHKNRWNEDDRISKLREKFRNR